MSSGVQVPAMTTTSRVPVRALPQLASAVAAGALFGFGLAWSTMIQPSVVLSFLQLTDLGLLLVMGGALSVTMVAYRLAPRLMTRPVFSAAFGAHESVMDRATIIGAAIFGIGWGVCGVCPGPSLAGLGAGSWELLYAIAGIAAGAWVHGVTQR